MRSRSGDEMEGLGAGGREWRVRTVSFHSDTSTSPGGNDVRFQFHTRDLSLTVWMVHPYNWGLRLELGGQMYAVIQTGGKQYRVAPGDTIRIERVAGEVGEKVTFGKVLAIHTDEKKIVLGDDASKASVSGKIVSQGRAKKITVLKFKKGNQYKISRGHRQNFTAVEVNDIKL